MEINIFVPENYSGFKYLYGIKRVELKNNKEVQAFYVTKCTETEENGSDLEILGYCGSENFHLGFFQLVTKNGTKKATYIKTTDKSIKTALIYLYDPASFSNFTVDDYAKESIEKYFFLYLAYILQLQNKSRILSPTMLLFNILDKLSTILSKIFYPLNMLFGKTAVYQHAKVWKKVLVERKLRNGTIVFDVILGLIVCYFMYHIKHPEDYFMSITEIVLNKLRDLLDELADSPIGFKLNVQLNNFLHKCFMYHVDLWWNFVIILEPAIHYLFIPITLSGLLGFSFQCAMLCDIITLITLHAHCFYIYAAMLYKTELVSLKSLWRIVLGRRYNVLKNRVESQNYSNRELFLATLFFTTLLFLLPTIIVYYIVFAILRLFIYIVTYSLMKLQRIVLMLPLYTYVTWFFGLHRDLSNIAFNLISFDSINDINVYQFQLQVLKSSPWKNSPYKKEFKGDFCRPLPINKFTVNLFYGNLMAFLPNNEST